jgi:hypothetical protein
MDSSDRGPGRGGITPRDMIATHDYASLGGSFHHQ